MFGGIRVGKILVVDPSLLDRKRMRSVLEAAGHAVMEMTNPGQVMAELGNVAPGAISLVLTELYFPDGNGVDLIQWMKQSQALASVPALIVTAQVPRETVIALVMAGASTVVTKPFGGDMLLRRVTETLAAQVALRQGEAESVTWHLDDYLRRELKRAERNGAYFSVVMCHVLDHMDGQALPHLMGGLVHIMRESDVLAKMGDDEIVILLPDTDWSGATVVESRVRAVLQGLEDDKATRAMIPIKAHTGAATFPTEAADVESLLALARSRSA